MIEAYYGQLPGLAE